MQKSIIMANIEKVLGYAVILFALSACSTNEREFLTLSQNDFTAFCGDTVNLFYERPNWYIVNTCNELLIVNTDENGEVIKASVCGQSLESYSGRDPLFHNETTIEYNHLKQLMLLHHAVNRTLGSDTKLCIDSLGNASIIFNHKYYSYHVLVVSSSEFECDIDTSKYIQLENHVYYKKSIPLFHSSNKTSNYNNKRNAVSIR